MTVATDQVRPGETVVRKMTSSDGTETINESDIAQTFGELVKLSCGVIERYHSDLYHDALFIYRKALGENDVKFLWSPNDCGTHIATADDEYLVDHVLSYWPNVSIYGVHLRHQDGRKMVTIHKMVPM